MTININGYLAQNHQTINISGNASITIDHGVVYISGSLNNTIVDGIVGNNILQNSIVIIKALTRIQIMRTSTVRIKSGILDMGSNDTLTLFWDGTVFKELARSKPKKSLCWAGNLTGNVTKFPEHNSYGIASSINFKNYAYASGNGTITLIRYSFLNVNFTGSISIYVNNQLKTTINASTLQANGSVNLTDLIGSLDLNIKINQNDRIYIEASNADFGGSRFELILS